MRINLGCGYDIRNGYINIDINKKDLPDNLYKQGDMENLDWLTDDNTIEEILALNILQYIDPNSLDKSFENWYKKLINGGVIKIYLPDTYCVAKALSQDQISMSEFQKIILGTKEQNDIKSSVLDLPSLKNLLLKNKFSINIQRYEGMMMYLEGIK